jgi:hypothetical protein
MIDEGRGNGECYADRITTEIPKSSAKLVKESLRLSQPFAQFVAREQLVEMDPKELGEITSPEQSADGFISNIALPHAEVPTREFFKHISADLTEPRRMRCLLGWCGTRAMPAKPDAPKESTSAASLEFQALQAGTLFKIAESGLCGLIERSSRHTGGAFHRSHLKWTFERLVFKRRIGDTSNSPEEEGKSQKYCERSESRGVGART